MAKGEYLEKTKAICLLVNNEEEPESIWTTLTNCIEQNNHKKNNQQQLRTDSQYRCLQIGYIKHIPDKNLDKKLNYDAKTIVFPRSSFSRFHPHQGRQLLPRTCVAVTTAICTEREGDHQSAGASALAIT